MTISSSIFLGLIAVLCFLIFKKSRFYRRNNNRVARVEKPVVKIAKPNYTKKEETSSDTTHNSGSKKYWE